MDRILDSAQAVKLRQLAPTLLGYASASLVLNLLWEAAQLPLYTVWAAAPREYLALAVLHCTAGDLAIALSSLVLAALPFAQKERPTIRSALVMAATVVLGIGYTIFSEWLNVHVRKTWAYSDLMPVLPGLDIGLSPLLQWLVVPILSFAWVNWRRVQPHAGV